jgi:hypothetical protein
MFAEMPLGNCTGPKLRAIAAVLSLGLAAVWKVTASETT